MMLLLLSLTEMLAFVPTARFIPAPAKAIVAPVSVQMNFFDDMQANFMKMMGLDATPSYEEAVYMCRDDESSGCTVDMLDVIAKYKGDVPPSVKPRWSKEIDDAVVKPE